MLYDQADEKKITKICTVELTLWMEKILGCVTSHNPSWICITIVFVTSFVLFNLPLYFIDSYVKKIIWKKYV